MRFLLRHFVENMLFLLTWHCDTDLICGRTIDQSGVMILSSTHSVCSCTWQDRWTTSLRDVSGVLWHMTRLTEMLCCCGIQSMFLALKPAKGCECNHTAAGNAARNEPSKHLCFNNMEWDATTQRFKHLVFFGSISCICSWCECSLFFIVLGFRSELDMKWISFLPCFTSGQWLSPFHTYF